MPDPTSPMPSALRARARNERLAGGTVPVLLVHPTWQDGDRVPLVLWMHGRTARKELDPGRYLRLMRAGFGVCAIDLPGHGDRFDPIEHTAERTLDLILQMVDEIDAVLAGALALGVFDERRLGIGGMSAGGMATMVRLCRPHPFACASVEGATGAWHHQLGRPMFEGRAEGEVEARDPIRNLHAWREIPFQAIHTRKDEWVAYEGQVQFMGALRARYRDPSIVEMVTFEATGAPFEHAGFGRFAAEAKNAQLDFFERRLGAGTVTS